MTPDDTLQIYTSPYRRTRETTEGLLSTLTDPNDLRDGSPSPFDKSHVKAVYEEPRIREQDFGNFQPCSAEMERMWAERADYGHFFYRIPNGESAPTTNPLVRRKTLSEYNPLALLDPSVPCNPS